MHAHWIAAFIGVAAAAVHDSLAALPSGWEEVSGALNDNDLIQLQVALQYSNLDQLETILRSVSDPSSPKYGQYLDIDQVNAIFGPSSSSSDAVMTWLKHSRVLGIASDNHLITFATTIGNANKMLDAEFKRYTDGERNLIRTLSYSVPDELSEHIDLVSPTTFFGKTQAYAAIPRLEHLEERQSYANPDCQIVIPFTEGNVTVNATVYGPDCARQLYNTDGYTPDPNSGSTVAFGNFLNNSASYADLAQYEQYWNIPSQNFTVLALINGGINDQDPLTETDVEANIDVQNIVSIAHGLPVYAYITGGSPPFMNDVLTQMLVPENQNEPYLPYYNYLLSQPNSALPYVISNSYGDDENTVPEYYAQRVCSMIGMMGIRGRTVLEATGDTGVGAPCRNNAPPYQPQFTPQFPGSCPWITAVGGTQQIDPEWAWNQSSGGFSFYFDQPWYQADAVNTYLNQYIEQDAKEYYSSNNFTNFAGRGYPDVAAHSFYPPYYIVINGTAEPYGGTSAACPIFAGVLALVNDARFRAGQPALGFANPWLYSVATQGLNDITEGASYGCTGFDSQLQVNITGAGIIPYATWNATVGWDPVTGLGTPDFVKLEGLTPAGNESGGWSDWTAN